MNIRVWISVALLAGAVVAIATGPEDGAFAPGQAIADEVRLAAGSDLAFIPGGALKDATTNKEDLSNYLQSGSDKIVVLKLTGKQVWNALERSVSMIPSANPSFLQLSGLTATYKTNSLIDRLSRIELDAGAFSQTATYTVAVPQTMAKGGYGFFTVWDDSAVQKTLPLTLAAVVKGKKSANSEPRYKTVKSEG